MGTLQADMLITCIARLDNMSADDLRKLCKILNIKGTRMPAHTISAQLITCMYPAKISVYTSIDNVRERLVITAKFNGYSVELDAYNGLYWLEYHTQEGKYDELLYK